MVLIQFGSGIQRLTYEDYLQCPEDRCRHEIIDGDRYASANMFDDEEQSWL